MIYYVTEAPEEIVAKFESVDIKTLLNQHSKDMLNWLENQFHSGALNRPGEDTVAAKTKRLPATSATELS